MATVATTRRIDAASWRALGASWMGWMFDGYETFALVLVAATAVRQLTSAEQVDQIPLYIGALLSVTLLGWATGGVIAGILYSVGAGMMVSDAAGAFQQQMQMQGVPGYPPQ